LIARDKSAEAEERPRPLSKQQIDTRIERVLADLSAAIDAAACGDGSAPDDPLRPRPLPAGALTSRMRKFLADN
jgi:hypothetical protein